MSLLSTCQQQFVLRMCFYFCLPKTPPELGSRLVFWRRGLGVRSAGAAPSSARNARVKKHVRSSPHLRETVQWSSPALLSTRNGHSKIKYPYRLRETVLWASCRSSDTLSPTRNAYFNIKYRSCLCPLVVPWIVLRALACAKRSL